MAAIWPALAGDQRSDPLGAERGHSLGRAGDGEEPLGHGERHLLAGANADDASDQDLEDGSMAVVMELEQHRGRIGADGLAQQGNRDLNIERSRGGHCFTPRT